MEQLTIERIFATGSGDIPYDLLLLSDDSKEAIDKNLHNGELYIGAQNGKTVASFVLKIIGEETIEIKNIAVTEDLQGGGIGTVLLSHIRKDVSNRGFKSLLVGTCDQCSREIQFYKKSGFVESGIRKDFFLENYDRPIYENGKQIIDMVLLKIDL